MKTLKSFLITIILFAGWSNTNAQTDNLVERTKAKLTELKVNYSQTLELYGSLNDSISALKENIDFTSNSESFETLQSLAKKNVSNAEKLNGIKAEADVYVKYYELEYKENEDEELTSLIDYFKSIQIINTKASENDDDEDSKQPKIFYYFGKDDVIDENDSIFNNPKYDKILKNILSAKSKNYLGDFVIPRDEQIITIIKKEKLKKAEAEKADTTENKMLGIVKKNYEVFEKNVKFKSIKLHIEHGLIQDIKVLVLDDYGNELLFENSVPISLLKYSRIAFHNYLQFSTIISNNKDKPTNTDFLSYELRLSEVLMYINNPGENYVPHDLRLEFPTKTEGTIDNTDNSVKYKIEQDTALENVLNLRSYTDFLGLFGDSPNGIVQVEGKADFYLAPFNLPNTHNYLFKKISPFVNYARLDNDQKNLSVTNDTINNNLEILEKSFLSMGLDLDIFSFKFGKEFPFETAFYGTARYNISNIENENNEPVNYKSLSLGGGMRFDIRRFNNFGLTLKSELTTLNTNELNTLDFINNPRNFTVFRNEAEIYYHPSESANQAIFLRLNTFGNSSSGQREAFYQLQFGYRFSIGVNKLNN